MESDNEIEIRKPQGKQQLYARDRLVLEVDQLIGFRGQPMERRKMDDEWMAASGKAGLL